MAVQLLHGSKVCRFQGISINKFNPLKFGFKHHLNWPSSEGRYWKQKSVICIFWLSSEDCLFFFFFNFHVLLPCSTRSAGSTQQYSCSGQLVFYFCPHAYIFIFSNCCTSVLAENIDRLSHTHIFFHLRSFYQGKW